MNINKNVARLATAAMVLASMVSYSPAAMAAAPTAMKDTMTRLKSAESSGHVVTFTTSGAANWAEDETITFNYSTPGFALADATPACAIAGGDTCTAATAAATDILTVTCTEATGCEGAVTLGSFTATNPTVAVPTSETIVVAGTSEYDGKLAVAITTEDQVTVTAQVDPTIIFDVVTHTDCSTADATIGTDHAIDFGYLTPGTYDADAGEDVCMKLETNATGGASVQYTALNDGFQSTTASYEMGTENTDGALVADVAAANKDGLFVSNVTKTELDYSVSGREDSLTETAATYADLTGATSGVVVNAGGWDTLATSTSPVDGGTDATHSYNAVTAQLGAYATVITPAAADYTNTLTFRATGTF